MAARSGRDKRKGVENAAYREVGLPPIFTSFVLPYRCAWGSAMRSEVFLASVAKPDPQNLWDLLSLRGIESFVESQRSFALLAASSVLVRIPVGSSQADSTIRFLDQGDSFEVFVFDLTLFTHRICKESRQLSRVTRGGTFSMISWIPP